MKSLFVLCFACVCLPLEVAFPAEAIGRVALVGPETKHLGVFRDSESPSVAFFIRNTGVEALRITGIMKTCGCAGAVADTDMLGVGATTSVRVVIAPYTLEGAFSKSVFVLTDAAGVQPLRLTVTGECVPLFSVRPSKSVDTGRLSSGACWAGAFDLEASAPAALGVPAVTADCPASVSAETVPSAAGGRLRWKVPVKLFSPTNGNFRCRIIIPVLAPTNRPPLTLEVAGRTGFELFALPSALSIPVSDETFVRTLRLRLSGSRDRTLAPAELRALPETEGLGVRAETEPGGGLAVTLSISPALAKRIASCGPLILKLSVPDAAPTAAVLRTPDASAK